MPVSAPSLAVCMLLLVASPAALVAQAQPFSIGDIEELVARGVSDVRIVQLARRDCLLFKLDATSEQRLQATRRASAALLRGLRTACYAGAALEVTSDPTGLEVWLGDRRVGATPWRSEVGRGVRTVAVSRGEWRESVTTRVPVDRLVRVHFTAPADTLAWPVEPTREGLAAALDRSVQWAPSRPEPVEPAPFAPRRPKSGRIVGAVLGAAAGSWAGYAIDPHSDSVAVDIVGGGALVGLFGWWLGKKLDDAAYKRRVKAYELQARAQDSAVAAWRAQMDAEHAAWLEQLVDSASAREHMRAESLSVGIRSENERIRARNRAALGPTVTTEPLP